ncbi:hypothetical protein CK203_056891 [Vitis vinifera]|uniref:Uncharacterized protein n=1 Tax=Vitis vinifera TaxID=29760 RepID=A0A438GW76_VITVI|nr:hypothetical protein CK203_056891 [Vitis vinifera]
MGFSNSLGKGGCDTLLKVQVERAKNGKGLVHIRCCYSNKYCMMAILKHSDFVTSSSGLCMLMEASRARTIEGHPYLEFASSDIGDPTVGTREAPLEVGELVLSRNIYNVNFRLMDARIYDQGHQDDTRDAINMTQERHIQQVKLSYTETKSRTFSATLRTTGKMLFTIWMMVFTMASTASTSSSTPKKKSCDVKC